MRMLLANVASASSRNHAWPVQVDTETEQLSCPCRGWTQRLHLESCPQVLSGRTCTCRRDGSVRLTVRTCRHVRQVAASVRDAGGIAVLIRLLQQQGASLGGRPVLVLAETRAAATVHMSTRLPGLPQSEWQYVDGLSRVQGVERRPFVVVDGFWRRMDGVEILGYLRRRCVELDPTPYERVTMPQLPTREERARAAARRAHARADQRRREAEVQRAPPIGSTGPATPVAVTATTPARPEWLGGGRAIILRD